MMFRKALAAPLRFMGRGLKAFAMRWRGYPSHWYDYLLPRTSYDYYREIGDGTGSSIVVACVNWMAKTFPEAPVVVVEEAADGTERIILRHPMSQKIELPNPYYSGPLLWWATIVDWATQGDAYWIKIRGGADGVAQLWWAPASTIEPKWPDDGKTYISHYEYKPGGMGEAIPLPPRDVVHFRYGLDPANTRKGLSPLRAVLKEIFTDEEAASFTASLMRNLGVPGVVISPKEPVAQVNAEEIKQRFKQEFGGDRRGEPMVATAPVDIKVLAFSPEQMGLRDLRRIPEERVSAIFGVAAMVVGLGAGLERSSFTNYKEAESAAWKNNLIPMQRLMAADLEVQLLPDFDTDPTHDVTFDTSRVHALQPDLKEVAEWASNAVRSGWAMVSDARRAVGWPARPGDDVYLRMMTVLEVPATKGTKEWATKQAGSSAIAERLNLVHRRLAERYEGEIERFFNGQAKRVRGRLGNIVNLRGRDGAKQVVTAQTLLPEEEDALLTGTLQPLWLAGTEAGWDVGAQIMEAEVAFDPADAAVALVLAEAVHRARRINDGTRANIGEAFAEGERRGYTIRQVVDGVPEDDFAALGQRVESYYAGRPLTIAQTEAMWSTGRGQGALYRNQGVQRVMMVDAGDDPPCVARNGRIVSLQAGESALGDEHPHGTLTLVPV